MECLELFDGGVAAVSRSHCGGVGRTGYPIGVDDFFLLVCDREDYLVVVVFLLHALF